MALTATLWHTLALFCSLLLSNFAYTVLDRLSGPFLGSQLRCHADALSPALLDAMVPKKILWIQSVLGFLGGDLGGSGISN